MKAEDLKHLKFIHDLLIDSHGANPRSEYIKQLRKIYEDPHNKPKFEDWLNSRGYFKKPKRKYYTKGSCVYHLSDLEKIYEEETAMIKIRKNAKEYTK